ncbi:MAG: MFS transporter [Solibacillus sp.]
MELSENRLWTKEFIIVSCINFFVTLIFFLLMVTIAVYAVSEFDASPSEAGLVTGIFIIGVLIGRLFIGKYIDSLGHKRMLFIGLTFFVLMILLYFIQLGLSFLLVNRFIHGIALGMASTATGTIVAQIIPVKRKGEGIGYYSMSNALAMGIGPFVGLFMMNYTTFPIIFSVCLILGVICLLISLLLRVPKLEVVPPTTETKGFKIFDYIERKALPIASVVLVTGFCYSSVLSFISFYAIEIGLMKAASFFFVVYAIAILVSRPFTGRLMDKKGANFIMYPAFISFGVGMLLLSVANNGFTLLLAGVLIGLGFGNMQSCTQAIAVKLTPPHRFGLATSTFFIALDAGLGFGPYLLGFIVIQFGFSNMYIIMGVFVLMTAILYYIVYGKNEKKVKLAVEILE